MGRFVASIAGEEVDDVVVVGLEFALDGDEVMM